MAFISQIQKKRLVSNIGGKKFETSTPTLVMVPGGLLAQRIGEGSIVQPCNTEGIPMYFLDRTPKIL